jgi:hypothetical protein
MRWLFRIVLAVVIIAVLVGAFCVYQGVSTSLHAEHVFHAAILTVQVLDEYVAQHDGQWPRSWRALEQLPPKQRVSMYEWPQDSQEVKKYVTVDFSANPQRLAKQTPAEFDAVRPIGPYYPFKDSWQVKTLLDTIRASTAGSERVH